jgi:hypothetical protein
MKKISVFILVILFAQLAISQTYELKTRTGIDTYKQMNIRIENNTAYVKLSDIPKDESIIPAAFDLAGLGINDASIIIPDDGNTYWFVNFDNPETSAPGPIGPMCIACLCGDRSGKNCDRTYLRIPDLVFGCINKGCYVCILKRGFCNSRGIIEENTETEVTGPFAIIKAEQIIFE